MQRVDNFRTYASRSAELTPKPRLKAALLTTFRRLKINGRCVGRELLTWLVVLAAVLTACAPASWISRPAVTSACSTLVYVRNGMSPITSACWLPRTTARV